TLRGKSGRTYKSKRPFVELLGIPYGNTTEGEHRFTRSQDVSLPLSPTDENGVFDATKQGPCCPQLNSSSTCSSRQNENCLTLNIYTLMTENAPKKLLPVIVHIHGGSFTVGSSDDYNGNRLLERDVVVASLNYRLGVLGLFCLNIKEAPGNAGMYDVVQALRFIKKHVHHFGGDPDRITITGCSAGSVIVTQLMASPMIRGEELFHRAIAMSGTALNEWGTSSSKDAEKVSLKIAQLVGCYDPTNSSSKVEVLDCMRQVSASQFVESLGQYQGTELSLGPLAIVPILPVIQVASDGPMFLDEHPLAVLSRKKQANIPLMMGTTRHDGSFALALQYGAYLEPNNYVQDSYFLKTKLVPKALQVLGIHDKTGAVFDALAHQYLGKDAKNSGNFTQMIPGLTDLHSVFFFKAAAYKTLLLHSRLQNESFWYSFDYSGKYTQYSSQVYPGNNPIRGGISHGDDLIYIFTIPQCEDLSPDDQVVSDRMVDYWVNFASNGNPNIEGDGGSSNLHENEGWPSYSEEHPGFVAIGVKDQFIPGIPSDYWQGCSCELWPELTLGQS
ncbi:unnamed protein product, partial [Allacma fusca]